MSNQYQRQRRESRPLKAEVEEQEYRAEFERIFQKDYRTYLLSPETVNYNDYLRKIQVLVKDIVRGVTTSQLRNVFVRIKNLQDFRRLSMLRPQLAYISGRADNSNKGLRKLVVLLDDLIIGVDNPEKLKSFQAFFESIIAYHKYYGGKD